MWKLSRVGASIITSYPPYFLEELLNPMPRSIYLNITMWFVIVQNVIALSIYMAETVITFY
jgi:hypothetical protein